MTPERNIDVPQLPATAETVLFAVAGLRAARRSTDGEGADVRIANAQKLLKDTLESFKDRLKRIANNQLYCGQTPRFSPQETYAKLLARACLRDDPAAFEYYKELLAVYGLPFNERHR